jgi:hypothetical protein
MSIWRQTTTRQRTTLLCLGSDEMLRNFSPYVRDILFKINTQQACRESVDPEAKRVVEDAVDLHNRKWKSEMEDKIRDGSLQAWIRNQHAQCEKRAAERKSKRWTTKLQLDGRI